MKIKKAILPVAGLGTRFFPATKAQPKEMLSVFDTPAIQFIVEEAVEAGIEEIIIVTGIGKHAIKDHFEPNLNLERQLEEKGKLKELALVRKIPALAKFKYVTQKDPLGDGHAILCALDLIDADEPVVVLFGDDLVDNPTGKNAVQQLIDLYEKKKSSVVLLEKIKKEDTEKYGIVDSEPDSKNVVKINSVVEKPKPKDAPSDLGIVGKFVLTPEIIQVLKGIAPARDSEIRLSAAFSKYLDQGGSLYGKVLEGVRFDTGDKIGFLRATLYFAQKKGVQIDLK